MKISMQGLSLALVAAGLAAVPGLSASAAGPAPEGAGESLVAQMREKASAGVSITRNPATGKVGFIRATRGDLLPSVAAANARSARDKAEAYLEEFAPAFGATAAQLQRADDRATEHGRTVVYEQEYRGVPVFGAQLRLHLDEQGDLTSVNGYAAPGLDLSTDPRLSPAEAGERAVRTVKADPPEGADATGLEAAESELVVYREGAVRGETGEAVLAYAVEVANGADVRDMVFVDAATGKPVNRYSMIHSALDRELYEARTEDDQLFLDLVWQEGDAYPGDLTESQLDLVDGTGESYWFFQNSFGRDSYDGEGATMRTVNNDPRISCPNANWNGVTTNYCDGVTGDDTVAHEWGHAYTEYTSGLIYQWQSGAMNESFSDIWGETVDMLNPRQNEQPDTQRTVGQCSTYTRGAIAMTINSPAGVAGDCDAAPAAFGPVFPQEGVTTDVVVALDDPAGGTANDGCTPILNTAEVAGKFAYVDRGTCTFAVKAQNAEDAGATGVVIGNNQPGPSFSISGSADIYGLMVSQADGARIKSVGTVNATIKDAATAPKDDSYRWLSGEADPAFGGAIRDMWNPNCYGDPGKVTDAEYHCSTDDGGGVHSNSGVPNHAYALLVDGGTYNGVDVAGVGLDKAAHVFWRAQSEYLTPTSDFTALADSLEASCTDLVGAPINALSTAPDAAPEAADPITAADCDSVRAAVAAVELRTEPVQCNFGPLLDQDTPALCGEGFVTETTWSEDFEDGLAGWTQDEELTFPEGRGYAWEAESEAPGSNATTVAFAPDPTDGSCAGDADDISSRNGLISPRMELPAGNSPRLSFDHYVATEAGWDGGNVKYRTNGGTFRPVPEAAYVFNGPNVTLETAAAGNTNPMAGEPAWTGTDGGELHGTWGTTIIDLAQLGKAGANLQFRFDFGRDGCNGFDGWYVDNLAVSVCEEAPEAVPSRTRAKAVPGKIREGGKFLAAVKVKARGATPTGEVEISHRGETIAEGTLNRHGMAFIRVTDTDDLRRGRNVLVAEYLGSETVEASQDRFTVRVHHKRRGR